MRREGRRINKKDNFSTWIYVLGSVLGVLMLAFAITFSIYSNKVKQNNSISLLDTTKVAELVPSLTDVADDSKTASTEIGKTVNEMEDENKNENTNAVNEIKNNNAEQKDTNAQSENKAKTDTKKTEEVAKKELSFSKPVEGDVIVEFAKDNLIYSKTLKEWITHKGVDIKADKTTTVQAAEAGTVKSIKNDPRYGLTIIIEHDDGYTTVYSCLLSAEFVVEGEKVEKNQTIGAVGNSAIFESAEEPHLHFELLKDNEHLDPMLYFK